MPISRKSNAVSLLKGLLAAAALTLICMLLIAAAITWLQVPDRSIRFLNQLVKFAAIILGTCICVKRGGEMGLFSGTLLGLAYMVLGYCLYLKLGGSSFDFSTALGEMLIGGAVGAVTGTVRANMHPARKRK